MTEPTEASKLSEAFLGAAALILAMSDDVLSMEFILVVPITLIMLHEYGDPIWSGIKGAIQILADKEKEEQNVKAHIAIMFVQKFISEKGW